MPTSGLRIGVVADGYHPFDVAYEGARLAAQAREAEDLGYDLFALSDHLHGPQPTLEPWTALTWAAATTTSLTLVTDVLGLPYRDPAVTAKMAETLHRLSGGRLILGIGNGGYNPEFAAFGLPARTPRAKVDALDEAVQIIHALWNRDTVSFAGQHHHLDNAQLRPQAATHPPIWIGGYGSRSLASIGRHADGWLPSHGRLNHHDTRTAISRIYAAAAATGRDTHDIDLAVNITLDPDERDTSSVITRLRAVADLGFRTILLAGLNTPAARHGFAHNVAPALRNFYR